jgi:hypothetical protein
MVGTQGPCWTSASIPPRCPATSLTVCLPFALLLDWPPMAVLLFCQCGSDRVDVAAWTGRRAQLRCASCGHTTWLDGFTVSDFDPAQLLTAALVDQARKHRKRSPEEVARIQSQRVGVGGTRR